MLREQGGQVKLEIRLKSGRTPGYVGKKCVMCARKCICVQGTRGRFAQNNCTGMTAEMATILLRLVTVFCAMPLLGTCLTRRNRECDGSSRTLPFMIGRPFLKGAFSPL